MHAEKWCCFSSLLKKQKNPKNKKQNKKRSWAIFPLSSSLRIWTYKIRQCLNGRKISCWSLSEAVKCCFALVFSTIDSLLLKASVSWMELPVLVSKSLHKLQVNFSSGSGQIPKQRQLGKMDSAKEKGRFWSILLAQSTTEPICRISIPLNFTTLKKQNYKNKKFTLKIENPGKERGITSPKNDSQIVEQNQ